MRRYSLWCHQFNKLSKWGYRITPLYVHTEWIMLDKLIVYNYETFFFLSVSCAVSERGKYEPKKKKKDSYIFIRNEFGFESMLAAIRFGFARFSRDLSSGLNDSLCKKPRFGIETRSNIFCTNSSRILCLYSQTVLKKIPKIKYWSRTMQTMLKIGNI